MVEQKWIKPRRVGPKLVEPIWVDPMLDELIWGESKLSKHVLGEPRWVESMECEQMVFSQSWLGDLNARVWFLSVVVHGLVPALEFCSLLARSGFVLRLGVQRASV